MRWLHGAMLAAWLLAGCQGDPYSSRYTSGRPNAQDLVGFYVPTKETMQLLLSKQYGYTNVASWIELRGDGTFWAHNIPDCWLRIGGDFGGQYDNGQGIWKLDDRCVSLLTLSFDSSMGISSVKDWDITVTDKAGRVSKKSGKAGGYGAFAHIVNETPPFILHLTVGDPDSGIALQYQRRSVEPGAAANQSQLVSSETNSRSAAAGSGR